AGGATSARLIEVELRVRDLERALHFYRDVIGLPFGDVETHAGDNIRHAHVTWGEWGERGECLMVNLYPAVEGEITRARVGFVVDELEPVQARLLSAGARVITAPERRPWGASAPDEGPDGQVHGDHANELEECREPFLAYRRGDDEYLDGPADRRRIGRPWRSGQELTGKLGDLLDHVAGQGQRLQEGLWRGHRDLCLDFAQPDAERSFAFRRLLSRYGGYRIEV